MDQNITLSLDRNSHSASFPSAEIHSPVTADTANQWTHGIGFLMSLVGAAFMLRIVEGKDWPVIAGCSIYCFTLVSLYAASTLSHSFQDPSRRSFFRILDQICIFLLIVGTYTPFGLAHLNSGMLSLLLGIMWAVALVGIVCQLKKGDGSVAVLFYVLLGWLPVLALGEMYNISGLAGLGLVLAGGLAYTGGTWFLGNDHRHPYFHAVWHLCTITGSLLHYLFLLFYVATC